MRAEKDNAGMSMKYWMVATIPLLLAGCAPSRALVQQSVDELVSIAQDELAIPVREGFATTPDGVRIYYRAAGTGPQVVIAPFALFHGDSLDPLARGGRTIVTYDPRGRGRSASVPAEKISRDHLLVDLDTVRRAVGADKPALIGFSGGGAEVFLYALRNPNHVSKIVQLAPVAVRSDPYLDQMMADRRARTDKAASDALRARIAAGEFAGNPEAHCRELRRVTLPPLLADPANYDRAADACQFPNEHPDAQDAYFTALMPSISNFDHRASLAKVTVPRLVVYPLQDNIPRAGVEEWVRGQPNARIVYIANSGHLPQHEQPEATLRAIHLFLDGRWPPDAVALPAL